MKGKYSIVPYPGLRRLGRSRDARLDRQASWRTACKLVRDFMIADWDIHPEMVTHTWVIDTKTGRPYRRAHRAVHGELGLLGRQDRPTSWPTTWPIALQVLKNVGLPCEGITTPGGFGNRVLPELAQATLQACRDVYQAEIPHYFRHLFTDDRSVAPRVRVCQRPRHRRSAVRRLDHRLHRRLVRRLGRPGSGHRRPVHHRRRHGGRLPEVIDRGEPAILVCHWPGIYFNGERIGFNIFKEVVKRLHARYDNLLWMKISEIARYWAAKELTSISREGNQITLSAPFATQRFTLSVTVPEPAAIKRVSHGPAGSDVRSDFKEVADPLKLVHGTWCREKDGVIACFDLTKGKLALDVV